MGGTGITVMRKVMPEMKTISLDLIKSGVKGVINGNYGENGKINSILSSCWFHDTEGEQLSQLPRSVLAFCSILSLLLSLPLPQLPLLFKPRELLFYRFMFVC